MPTKSTPRTGAKKTTAAAPSRNLSRADEEIWECTIPGRISMSVANQRGGMRTLTVKGKGQILRITTMDRELAEEVVRDPANDPFRNGALVRVDGRKGSHQPSNDELSDADLTDMFSLEQDDFTNIVPTLSELNIRRLREMAPTVNARHAQVEFLKEYVEEHFAIGGPMPSYTEMQAQPM